MLTIELIKNDINLLTNHFYLFKDEFESKIRLLNARHKERCLTNEN